MSLTTEEIKHIALLARIGVSEEELEKYQKDLSAVFDFFQELKEVDTDSVDPIRHITGLTDVMRGDVEKDFAESGKQKIRENLPDKKDNFVKVRSVF